LKAEAPNEGDTKGFALILVVWFLVLVGAIGAFVVANGRAEVAIASNVQAAAHAEALADAGIARTVFNQTDSVRPNRWKLDGTSHNFTLPSGRIEIRLADEARKINPNLASGSLLAALFEVRGLEHGAAERLGASVADWVKPQQPAKGTEPDPYRAAGRSYGPPHAPIGSLDELGLVLGMTPEILDSVRPYLTIYSEAAAPDAKTAPLVIQRALAMAARASETEGNVAQAPPAVSPPTVPSPVQTGGGPPAQPGNIPVGAAQAALGAEHLIEAEIIAHSSDGGVFVRYAVIKIPEGAKARISVLDWRRGTLDTVHGQQR
jgi:general secretion pathway protein K